MIGSYFYAGFDVLSIDQQGSAFQIVPGKLMPCLLLGWYNTGNYHTGDVGERDVLHCKQRIKTGRQFIGGFLPVCFQAPMTGKRFLFENTAYSM
jgi:hypothetical protein